MSAYHLFLDDERKPSDVTWVEIPQIPWTIVRNYSSFVAVISERGLPLHISFDHDLGQEHYVDYQKNMAKFKQGMAAYINYDEFQTKTGYHCVKWLIDYCLDHNLPFPEYTVHSMNPIGKDNIISLIESFKTVQNKPENNMNEVQTEKIEPKVEEIIVPDEVQALFDEADADGQFAAMICPDAIKLTSKDGLKVFKTVMWADAGKWGRNAMQIISKNMPE